MAQKIIIAQIQAALDQKLFPGCSIGYTSNLGRKEHLISSETSVPLSTEKYSQKTMFDISSLTKPIVALVALKLIDQGTWSLEEPVGKYFSQKQGVGWEKVELKHLLTNSLELNIDQKLYELLPSEVENALLTANVKGLGDNYYYRNSTAVILGWMLESFFSAQLSSIIHSEVTKPAEMSQTFWGTELVRTGISLNICAPTEKCPRRGTIHGMPHDDLAYMFAEHGQDIGCAGLFSTTEDMVKFGNYFSTSAFSDPEKMMPLIKTNYLKDYGRTFGLGFDFPDPAYICSCFSKNTLVHTGYTGCALWIQPEYQRTLVILSNATYPTRGDRGSASPLADFRKSIVKEVFFCKHCHS